MKILLLALDLLRLLHFFINPTLKWWIWHQQSLTNGNIFELVAGREHCARVACSCFHHQVVWMAGEQSRVMEAPRTQNIDIFTWVLHVVDKICRSIKTSFWYCQCYNQLTGKIWQKFKFNLELLQNNHITIVCKFITTKTKSDSWSVALVSILENCIQINPHSNNIFDLFYLELLLIHCKKIYLRTSGILLPVFLLSGNRLSN